MDYIETELKANKCAAVAKTGDRLATIDMGRKLWAVPLFTGIWISHLNTVSPRPRPTCVPSGILIHPAIRPQQTWAENCGGGCAPFFGGGGSGSPSNTMWPGPRPTSIPSCILIYLAVWPQQTWVQKWGAAVPPFWGGGAGSPSNTMSPGPRPSWHLDPSSGLATTDMGRKLGAVPRWGRGAGSPSNTVWPGPRPTSMPSSS